MCACIWCSDALLNGSCLRSFITYLGVRCAGVAFGVGVYTLQDIHFNAIGYTWVALWYASATFEQVWVKKVVDTIQMTTWSRTYYQVRPWLARDMLRRSG